REPREIECRATLAVEMRRHAEQRADGDDAGATDAGDQDGVGRIERTDRWQRQISEQLSGIDSRRLETLQRAAVDRDKAWTKPFDAGKILVAVGLVDLALAAELGIERLYRDAVRRDGAIAAALADQVIDEDALGRIGIDAALAPPPLFGRAGLVVDQDRKPFDLAQFPLHLVHLAAVMDGRSLREIAARRVLAGIVGDDGQALGALGPDLMRNLRDVKTAFGGLAAGHGDGV